MMDSEQLVLPVIANRVLGNGALSGRSYRRFSTSFRLTLDRRSIDSGPPVSRARTMRVWACSDPSVSLRAVTVRRWCWAAGATIHALVTAGPRFAGAPLLLRMRRHCMAAMLRRPWRRRVLLVRPPPDFPLAEGAAAVPTGTLGTTDRYRPGLVPTTRIWNHRTPGGQLGHLRLGVEFDPRLGHGALRRRRKWNDAIICSRRVALSEICASRSCT